MAELTAAQFLADTVGKDYRPTILGSSVQTWIDGQRGWFSWREVEAMRRDPDISLGLYVLRAPMPKVKWTVKSNTAGVAEYVDRQLKRFWKNDRSKALRVLEYGNAAGRLDYKLQNGLIEYNGMLEFHIADVHLRQYRGTNRFAGFQLNQGASAIAEGLITAPRAFWAADRAEFGSFYGRPRLQGAYAPWREANGRHGGKDIRRLLYLKNSFRGGIIWHPTGVVQHDDGSTQSYQDYSREVVEKGESGGVYAFPNNRDALGNKLWEYQDPKSNGDIAGVRDYVKDLSEEKWTGMGIPVEVIRAQETGSWAGRTIPFMVYLSGEDEIAEGLITAFDQCGCRHAVKFNFGEEATYAIEMESLLYLANADPTTPGEQGQEQGQGKPLLPSQKMQRIPTTAYMAHDPRPVIDERLRRRAIRRAVKHFPETP